MKLLALASVALFLCRADAYAAPSRRGSPVRREDTPTPTVGPNGITTPSPVDSSIASNCNLFTLYIGKESISFITDSYNITLDEFYAWNPSLGGDPSALLQWYYYCAGIIGDGPNPPPPTNTTSTISTPYPAVFNMLPYCSTFHLKAGSDDTCESISAAAGITVDKFVQLNPDIESAEYCAMWAAYWYCTAIIIPNATYWPIDRVGTP